MVEGHELIREGHWGSSWSETPFLGRDLSAMQSVSPQTLDKLDAEIRMLVEEGQRIARTRLQQRRAQVDLLADELEALETLDGEYLARLLVVGDKPKRARR